MSPSLLQPTLFLLIPLFSIALIVLACSHSPGHQKPQAILAYIYIASVTLLSTLAGALPLSHSSNSLSESLIQALLFLFIGIPVLDLAPTYVPQLSIRKVHTSILVITLSIATLSALISPFLPTTIPLPYISPSLFLLYTLQSIPRIAYILNNFLYPQLSIPLTLLPSPASTASFPIDTPRHHHKIPSVSTTSTITVVDRFRIPFPLQQDQLRAQIVHSRSRSLLVFILAVQVASLAANACALGVTISASHNPTTLKTIQTVCTVLALTGSMSAYLLHTYNLQLRQNPTATPANCNQAHSPDQLQMIEPQQNSHSPMLVQLAPPPLAKARPKRSNAGISIEKNLEANIKATDPDLQLELDLVVDIGRYSMTLGQPPTRSRKKKNQDSIDLELRLVSSPACTPASPVPLPLRVSVEEGSECGVGGFFALEKREKEKIQEYYLSSSISPSTCSPSSPFSPFECSGTETDLSSPDIPYSNTGGGNPGATRDDSATNDIVGTTQVRKRSSFFDWEFAWDQEALERADDARKLRSAGGGSPNRWKSDLNPSASNGTKKIQPLLIVDQENFMALGEVEDPSRPHSLSSEAEVRGGGRMKRGISVGSAVGGEKVKRKNTLGLVIGMRPLRMSRSFGGTSNSSGVGGRGIVTGPGTAREMGHRTILSRDVGPMCGLSLKRKATALIGEQKSPVSLVAPVAVSSCVTGHGNGDAMITIATPVPTTPKKLKKKTKPEHSSGAAGTSPSAESEIGERNGKDNHLFEFIHGDNQNSDSDNDELDVDGDLDADQDTDWQKTPTMKLRTKRSYSHSPRSYRHSSSASPSQQHHETATSESRCSSINESCISTSSTATANMNSPPKLSPSLTRGLTLKRSFKMGSTVGRTLGPGLTLSSAGLRGNSGSGSGPFRTSTSPYKSIRRCESEGFGFREEGRHEEKEKWRMNLDDGKIRKAKMLRKDDNDVDVDVEAEMRSPGAATSAWHARAMATAIILTPVTGNDVCIDIGVDGGASRSREDGCSDEYTTKAKSMLNSRPSLPARNTGTITPTPTSALHVRSTVSEQYQHRHQQDEHNSVFSTAVWKHHPFVGWFGPSTSRGDADIGQEMEIIRNSGRGHDNDGLSSLPQLPSLQPLLLPPMTPLPSQSRSLPPTPTKSRSTLLGKPSISSFRKRSAPPALPVPPPHGSSKWVHSMSTMSRMGGAAVSMVSLAHSRTHSGSKPSSQPPSRPTTPKPSMRLSAMNMGTVRNAFAGVGAKMSARMSINSATTRGSAVGVSCNTVAPSLGIGMDDGDGDFMDLRDPFAPPPPSKLVGVFRGGDHPGEGASDFWVSERAMSSMEGGAGTAEYDDDDDSVEVGITRRVSGGKRRANMNAWGRLPMPCTLPLPGSAPEASSVPASSVIANRQKAHSHHGERRKNKEKLARKVVAAGVGIETNSTLNGYISAYNAGEEDVDFGVEEALLSQRLLRRLDSIEWE